MTLNLRFSMLIRLRLSGISVVDMMRRDDLQGVKRLPEGLQ